jgi:hypothetical protein
VDTIKNVTLDACGLYNVPDLARYSSLDHAGIRDEHHALGAKPHHLPSSFFGNTRTER